MSLSYGGRSRFIIEGNLVPIEPVRISGPAPLPKIMKVENEQVLTLSI